MSDDDDDDDDDDNNNNNNNNNNNMARNFVNCAGHLPLGRRRLEVFDALGM
jgi:hypothetical protein